MSHPFNMHTTGHFIHQLTSVLLNGQNGEFGVELSRLAWQHEIRYHIGLFGDRTLASGNNGVTVGMRPHRPRVAQMAQRLNGGNRVMIRQWKHRPIVWGSLGLLLGTILAGFCPHAPLHASATDRYKSFAIATGMVDNGVEALYFLDFLTGDLKAAVLSRQIPPRFNAFYQRNIINDLGIDPMSNQPQYLMVTGLNDLRRGGSRLRPSTGVCYIAEINSGRVAAYAIPWDANRHASGQSSMGEIILLDVKQFRTAAVRP